MNSRSMLISLLLISMIGLVSAQDSTGISYQALVQSVSGSTTNTTIGVRLSILQDSATGPSVYTERQTPMSNQYGMITLEIGTGTAESGTFGGIDWSTGRYFIKSEIDPAGGTNYSITGTYEQLSVPYAFYAREASRAPKAGKAESVSIRVSETGDTLFVGSGGQLVVIPGISEVKYPPQLPDSYVVCDTSISSVISSVTSTTGAVWMDRNLGASRVATASDDSLAYGDLYQWGRFADGHQCRGSDTTSIVATTSAPDTDDSWYGKFITDSLSIDWLSVPDSNLWQGVNGVNNPCPSLYRLPTLAEWQSEVDSWNANNNLSGAIASPLKLPAAGSRLHTNSSLSLVGSKGNYWASSISSVSDKLSTGLNFDSGGNTLGSYFRARGRSVRCIKD